MCVFIVALEQTKIFLILHKLFCPAWKCLVQKYCICFVYIHWAIWQFLQSNFFPLFSFLSSNRLFVFILLCCLKNGWINYNSNNKKKKSIEHNYMYTINIQHYIHMKKWRLLLFCFYAHEIKASQIIGNKERRPCKQLMSHKKHKFYG